MKKNRFRVSMLDERPSILVPISIESDILRYVLNTEIFIKDFAKINDINDRCE